MDRDLFRRPVWRAHLLALAVWAAASALRYVLDPWFPPGFPYLTYFPAVVLVAYFAGLRPAVLTAVLSGLTAWWFWIGAPGFDVSSATLLALAFYVFVVAVDIFFIVGMDGASRRLAAEVERNAALARSRDILLREVQHRVSNNIQVVSALLQLEARAATDPGARKALGEAAARTALVARIQRSLSDADGQPTAFRELAGAIVEDALAAAGRTDVQVEIAGSAGSLSAEEATPVTLILLEAVNNALEHAFPGRPGRLEIRLDEAEGTRRLTVADDGIGVPAGGAGRTEGLGLRLVQGLARQLGGDWDLTPGETGALARLTWPAAPTDD
ncbi:MAG TPA: histidine kinase dimerization/phosphoacceptor domain -containing protein [Brevundimonas sp.]|jgi:two-component sensor histidine kinase|uniref:sensor histidine kinase n=1 Tax=Brevundimonas sp. TaxID=1871086 RepID=UPI002E0F756B|nr:histidine kinase dimerization/phosphoacceptor domain -containing protein [Brevundimonas sp.]